jgi:hypothetical protein
MPVARRRTGLVIERNPGQAVVFLWERVSKDEPAPRGLGPPGRWAPPPLALSRQ